MTKYYADDDINNPKHPEFDRNFPVGTTKKATPKLRYHVSVDVHGETVKEAGLYLEEVVSWFNCHNTDPVFTTVSIQMDHHTLHDNFIHIGLVLDARIEDLEPACEQFAKGAVQVTIREKNELTPGKSLFQFNKQSERY